MSGRDPVERIVDAGGRPVRVLERGAGDAAVVLLHGGMHGHSPWIGAADLWAPLMREMPAGERVIALDMPGCGGTPIADVGELTIAGAAERVAQTLTALGVRTAVPVGHAEASLVALLLAREEVEGLRVPAAAVIAASGAAPTSDGVPPVALMHPPRPRGSAASIRWALDHVSYSDAHITDALVQALARHAEGDAQRAAAEQAASQATALMLESDLLGAKLAFFAHCRDVGYDVPLSIIWGSHDPLLSVAHGDGLFELMSTTSAELDFNLVNRVGHLPFSEDPAATRRLLEPFVARALATEAVR